MLARPVALVLPPSRGFPGHSAAALPVRAGVAYLPPSAACRIPAACPPLRRPRPMRPAARCWRCRWGWRRPAAALPAELRFRVVRQGSAIGTHRVGLRRDRGGADRADRGRHRGDAAGRHRLPLHPPLRGSLGRRPAGRRHLAARPQRQRDGDAGRGGRGRHPGAGQRRPLPPGRPRRRRSPGGTAGGFDRPLFANDTGKPLALRWTRSALPGGGTLWRATGEEESEATYAADGTWVGWKTRAEDGSTVVYERL